jgi:hypothetical protein
VMDLGEQPACDYFPRRDDPGPDPLYPLQMWLCASCGLAQLVADTAMPEEPRGVEPAALIRQAADAVARVDAAGLLPVEGGVAEYGSPHGGTWLDLLSHRGLTPVDDDAQADVVVDCFGLMHAPDQSAALAERVARVATGGLLLLQYHSLHAIIRHGQWNMLRHGHYAYYSTTALLTTLAAQGFRPETAWHFELYGGTLLLAARRDAGPSTGPDEPVQALLAAEARAGALSPEVLSRLQRQARTSARALHAWLAAQRNAGKTVLGYGAASRAVAFLVLAGADRALLPGVADASAAKEGLRMPGTDIPVISPAQLVERRPDFVVLFVPDLLSEVRASLPQVEAGGGQWVAAEGLRSPPLAACD